MVLQPLPASTEGEGWENVGGWCRGGGGRGEREGERVTETKRVDGPRERCEEVG